MNLPTLIGGGLIAGVLAYCAWYIFRPHRPMAHDGNEPTPDGEPRDVGETTVYVVYHEVTPETEPRFPHDFTPRAESSLGVPLPGGVAAWLIAETEAEWAARQAKDGQR